MLRGDASDLLPGLERPLLREAPERVRDAAPGRVDVQQLPRDCGVQHLPERLRGLEAMPLRERATPAADLVRPQVNEPHLTERRRRLREQPAQLLDRLRFRLMLSEILVDEPTKSQRP